MNLVELVETESINPVMLFGFALVLGALHALEPGHSKTMMAAYIVAIQGTVSQAVLLGVSAAFSHSIIVWALAFAALTWGNALIGEQLEPYFIIVSGVIVLGIAAWMLWQTRSRTHGHHHDHGHHHHHDHDLEDLDDAHLDAHARFHAAEIRNRVAAGKVGTWQTILFGLSGGLIPCPAAITVFILCLHLDRVTLGVTLVSAFSIGLAIMLVAIGIVAAVGLKFVSSRNSRLDRLLQAAPWISVALIAVVGIAIIWTGFTHLQPHGHVH